MKRFLFILWQWIWGLPQNIVGGILYLYFKARGCPHFKYQGALVTQWKNPTGSMSMGRFLFMDSGWRPHDHRLLSHEYGHSIQSMLLGPLFLPLVGLPSILWAGLPKFQRMRLERQIPYDSVYPENWANRCGDRFAKTLVEPEIEIRV